MDINFQQYFLDHLTDLQNLIKIPSVYDAKTITDEAPCGRGVADALDYMADLAKKDGFEVLTYDGHAIAIRIKDGAAQGEQQIGASSPAMQNERIDVVSHLDVVEPGMGWTIPPFCGEVKDGRLYGRGSQDMKAPAFLTYLALKLIRDEHLPLKRELRIVLGTDEERTMNDMFYYVSKADMPAFAFTPDGFFPMAIGEKGSLMWRLSGKYDTAPDAASGDAKNSIIEKMDCGVQCNVVAPVATALLKDNQYTAKLKELAHSKNIPCDITEKDGKTCLKVTGKAAHASTPEEGCSATIALFSLLKECGDSLMDNLYQCFEDFHGRTIGIKTPDSNPAAYTMNLGIFRIENGACYGEVDARYPFGMSSAECTDKLSSKCSLKLSLDYDSPPTMNDPEDPYVNALLSTYREKTGDYSDPIISGGVSYSKVFGHCVAFGPAGAAEPLLAHQADESVSLDYAGKVLEIYYEAMKRIALL